METVLRKLSSFLWIVLLVVLGVASTSSIRWVSPAMHIQSGFGPSRDLTYALILGLIILITAVLTPARGPARWSVILKVSMGLLVGGIVLSSFLATDKSLAFYAGSGLLIGLVLMATTCKLADKPWKIHLALIVITTLGAVFSAKAWIREKVEIDQTWQNYVETRNELWARQGKSLDDPSVKMFEARMLSRDNGGFFFHGNLGGMYLATVFFVSLAMVGRRFVNRKNPYGIAWLIGSILLTLFILSALILTLSKGAILATVLTSFLIAGVWVLRKKIASHFRLAVVTAVGLTVLAGAGLIGYGLVKKTLPTLSMAYRWQYWIASYEMFKDHPLAGVGLSNYGHYYQQYKLPQAEEEITSPHNFVVQGFTELGTIGGVGFLLLPFAILYQIARDKKFQSVNPKMTSESGPNAPIVLLSVMAGVFGLLFLFNQSGLPGPLYLLAEYFPYLIIFPVAFVLCGLKGDRFDTIDISPVNNFTILCLVGALIAFIAGDIVNFSLEEPSTQFLFFFIAGLALAAVRPADSRPVKFGWANIVYLAAAILFSSVLVYPAVKSENAATEGAKFATSDPAFDPAYQEMEKLADQFTYDPHLASQAGSRLIELSKGSQDPVPTLLQATEWFRKAIEKAPNVWQFHSQLGQAWLMLADIDPNDKLSYLEKSESSFEQAYRLARRSKNLAMTLGLLYVKHIHALPADQKDQREKLTDLAKKHLNDALSLDRALPEKSIRRLGERQVREIQSAMSSLNP